MAVDSRDVSHELFFNVTLVAESVEFFIGSENVADTGEFSATAVARFFGDVAETVGRVVSGASPVVKVQVELAGRRLPATSRAVVVTVAV